MDHAKRLLQSTVGFAQGAYCAMNDTQLFYSAGGFAANYVPGHLHHAVNCAKELYLWGAALSTNYVQENPRLAAVISIAALFFGGLIRLKFILPLIGFGPLGPIKGTRCL